jgi:hypothetical protein
MRSPMLARFFALADRKLGASFQLPSMSEGLQNSVERQLIVNGCGIAVSKIRVGVRSSDRTMAGSSQRQDLLMNLG